VGDMEEGDKEAAPAKASFFSSYRGKDAPSVKE